MLSIGEQLGRYRIHSALGAGGMGEVFLAEDIELERLVALKVLPQEFSNNSERIQRFVQEAKAASALNHPNILTIHEIGSVKEKRFIASEYIKGLTLRDKLKHDSLDLSEILEIAVQITSALQSAHAKKIVHRDIKPENIMLREDNLVKVLDFGLAKLTEIKSQTLNTEAPTRQQVNTKAGVVLGTVAYMSPEQARGKTVDARTDIFSLGVVLYEMLTGMQPFYGETNSDIIAAILLKEPENPRSLNPAIPDDLERIIFKTLRKDREERYQTARELLSDLKELKQELDYKSKVEGSKSVYRPAEAKTEIIEADTSRNVGAATHPVAGFSLDKIPLLKSINKSGSGSRPKFFIFLALAFICISLVAIFLIPAIFNQPPKPEAVKLFNLGTEALRDGAFYKASKMLEDAVGVDGNFANARAGLAEAWAELDYFGRAQSEMLKVNELQRKRPALVSLFSRAEDSLYIGAINATVLRDFPQAVGIYQKIADRNPQEPYVWVDLGRAYEKNEETDKALECYEKAVNLNSQYGAAFLRLGILLRRKTDYGKSNEAFDRAENIYDRLSNDEGVAEVKFQRGVSLNAQEKLDAARGQFEQVIANPRANKHQQIRAMLQISSSCSGEGKTACAEEYAFKAINLAKDERMENVATNGLIDLGNSFLARSDYGKAEQNFQQALEFARKDEGLRNEARALLALGSLRIQQKRPDEAQSFVTQALPFFQKGSYNKEVSQAHLISGRASEMKENYDGALREFERVENSESAPAADKAYAKMVSGNVLMRQEKYPEALRRFQQSNQLYQSLNNPFYNTYSLFYLSDALFQLGRFEEAKDKLEQARGMLKEGHSLIPRLTAKVQILNARIALTQQNFAEAIKAAQQAVVDKDSSEAFSVNLILGLAQTGSNPKNPEGVRNCLKALQYAEGTKELRAINTARLALAEAYLKSGNLAQALETALQAKDYFISSGQFESGWRAWMIAAQASSQKADPADARNYAANALEALSRLKNGWGPEYFDAYLAKPDANLYYKQAEILAKSS